MPNNQDTAIFGWHGRRISNGPPLIFDREHPDGSHSAGLTPDPRWLEVIDCADCGESFARRTDRSPSNQRPVICHPCYMATTEGSYRVIAEELLDACGNDDRVEDAELAHTGGGCYAVDIRFTGQAEQLQILVGDGEDGPLSLESPPTCWGASLSFWAEDEDQTDLWNVDVVDTVAELLDALHPLAMRASKGRAEREAMAAESQAIWDAQRLAYWDEHNPEVAAGIRADSATVADSGEEK